MERRAFIVMTLAAVGWPLAVGAQQKMPVIGWLGGPSSQAASNLAAFRQGLRETGYVQEQNVAIEYRWTEGHPDRAP
jgi:putative ABC transport system substrate-binding protein